MLKYIFVITIHPATMALLGWAFASHAKGWVFKSWLPQTLVIKTGSDISTAHSW